MAEQSEAATRAIYFLRYLQSLSRRKGRIPVPEMARPNFTMGESLCAPDTSLGALPVPNIGYSKPYATLHQRTGPTLFPVHLSFQRGDHDSSLFFLLDFIERYSWCDPSLSGSFPPSASAETAAAQAQDTSDPLIKDQQLLQIMCKHVRSLNQSVVKTVEKLEQTINTLEIEGNLVHDGRG